MVDQGIAIPSAISLAVFVSQLCELPLHDNQTFRRECINGHAGIHRQQSFDCGAEGVIMGRVSFLDMIQKSDGHRFDGNTANEGSRLSRCNITDSPFCNALGIVLGGFGGTELPEVDSFSVDTDEGGASVVAHLGRGRM